jgi:hypothetical protein
MFLNVLFSILRVVCLGVPCNIWRGALGSVRVVGLILLMLKPSIVAAAFVDVLPFFV